MRTHSLPFLSLTAGLTAAAVFVAAARGTEPAVPEGPNAGARLPDREVVEFVDRRIAEWEVKPEDRRFDETGWATEIVDALRLAREHGRPVFLFTHDGRMGIGRC